MCPIVGSAGPRQVLPLFHWRIVSAESLDHLVLELFRVDRSIVPVEYLATRRENHGVRQRTWPFRIERLHQRIGTRVRIEEIQRPTAFRREKLFEMRRR